MVFDHNAILNFAPKIVKVEPKEGEPVLPQDSYTEYQRQQDLKTVTDRLQQSKLHTFFSTDEGDARTYFDKKYGEGYFDNALKGLADGNIRYGWLDSKLKAADDKFSNEIIQQTYLSSIAERPNADSKDIAAYEKFKKDHIYNLGRPLGGLLYAGIKDYPIKLTADILDDKSKEPSHPFKIDEMMGLLKSIQRPLAVFDNPDVKKGGHLVLTDLTHEGHSVVAIIEPIRDQKTGSMVNAITSIHYRYENTDAAKWINRDLLKWADPDRMPAWISKELTNAAHLPNRLGQAVTRLQDFINLLPDSAKLANKSNDLRYYRDNEGKIYGFATQNGEIYLDKKNLNFNAPVHEFGHLWLDMLKKDNPELYGKGIDLIKGTDFHNDVLNDEHYSSLGDTEKQEEALVRAMGSTAQDMIDKHIPEEKRSTVKGWLNDFFTWLGSKFGLRNLSPDKIKNLSLKDFTKGAVGDLLSGENLTDRKKTPDYLGTPAPIAGADNHELNQAANVVQNHQNPPLQEENSGTDDKKEVTSTKSSQTLEEKPAPVPKKGGNRLHKNAQNNLGNNSNGTSTITTSLSEQGKVLTDKNIEDQVNPEGSDKSTDEVKEAFNGSSIIGDGIGKDNCFS